MFRQVESLRVETQIRVLIEQSRNFTKAIQEGLKLARTLLKVFGPR